MGKNKGRALVRKLTTKQLLKKRGAVREKVVILAVAIAIGILQKLYTSMLSIITASLSFFVIAFFLDSDSGSGLGFALSSTDASAFAGPVRQC